MDGKIVAIVITYFSNLNELFANIKQYIDHVDKLIIWENTPIDERLNYKITLPEYYNDKVIYLSTDRNEGIAYPLNRCINWALENQYSYILAMDQDSYWKNFAEFLKCVSLFVKDKANDSSIYTPNINNYYQESQKVVEKSSFITSGTLFPIKLILTIGHFNEALFVDGVDLDYSLRLAIAKMKIIVFTNTLLKQNFGYPVKSNYYKFSSSNYSAERTHNIVKNHLLILRKYRAVLEPEQKQMIIRGYILNRLIKIVLIENNKFSKIIAIIKAVIFGLGKPLSRYFN